MTPRVKVKTNCDTCGEVSTTIDNVVLRILDGSENRTGHYRFLCPGCHTIVIKEATRYVIDLLSSADVKIELYNLSVELLERPREADASPISVNEIIDLHFQLEEREEEWMNRMLNTDQ